MAMFSVQKGSGKKENRNICPDSEKKRRDMGTKIRKKGKKERKI